MRSSYLVPLVFTALAAASSTASAADLPMKYAPPAAAAYTQAFSWTGFYIGANAGVGFADQRDSINLPAGSIVGSGGTNGTLNFNNKGNDTSFVGGGQIGYNWQFGAGSGVVIGVEADIQYADLGAKGGARGYTFTPVGLGLGLAFAPPGATVIGNDHHIGYFGTVRGRLGYAWDRVLVYGTGGLAYGGDSQTNTGYAAGGGVEYAWSPHFTVRLEGLYVDLGRNGGGGAPVYNLATNTLFLNGADRTRDDFAVVRVGLNYKF